MQGVTANLAIQSCQQPYQLNAPAGQPALHKHVAVALNGAVVIVKTDGTVLVNGGVVQPEQAPNGVHVVFAGFTVSRKVKTVFINAGKTTIKVQSNGNYLNL